MKKLRILIGCEESQTVCKEFRKRGHEAYSCDIQECSGGHPEWHLQMDVFEAIGNGPWDIIILHPPCTYTSICGNRWYSGTKLRQDGIEFCVACWTRACDVCDNVVLEQPKTIMQRYLGPKSQTIHPWQFGHGERKETWLWIKGLPLLQPSNVVGGREQRIFKMAPSPNRQKERSKTFPGIAAAMAAAWSEDLTKTL
jgi:hypothetical protein